MATTGQDGGGTVYIRPVVSADGVAAGVADIKQEFASIPGAADQATKATNKSLSSLGAGGGKGLDEVSAATQRAVKQIERLNLEIESGGRNTAAYIAGRAKLAGADVDALAPLIAQNEKLRAVQALANAEFTKSGKALDQFGMSAKQTTAALRQVPAQFTDIVVSLQGGQAPLTVLLQQGGQLKDIFGSAGGAAKALGGYVLGLVNPLSLTAAAVGAVGYAAYAASEDVKALRNAVALAGTQSTTSFSALSAAAKGLHDMGVSSSTAREALATFINAGAKVDGTLQGVTKAAIDLERVGGASIEETAKKLVALAKDPLADFDNLTLATYKQIEALLEQGNKTEAVRVAQEAFIESANGQSKALAANLGPLDTATKAWGRYATSVWDAVKALSNSAIGGITGRAATGDEERAELQRRRDIYAKQGYDTTKEDARLAYFAAVDAAQKNQIANAAKEIRLKELLANFDKNDESTKRLRDRNKLIADNTELLEAGLISQQKYNDALAAFDKKGAKASKAAPKETITDAQRSLASYLSDVQKRIDKEEELTEVQKAQNLLASLGTLGQIAQVRELVLGRAALVDTQVEEGKAAKESAKALEEKSKALDKWYDLRVKDSADLDSQISKRQKEVDAIGETAEAIGELTAAKYDEAAANKESYAAALQNASAYAGEFKDAYLNAAQDARDQAAKLRELSRLSTLEGTKKASVEAAKEAAKAWQKGWEETDRLARDVFVTWAEDGTNAAKKIGDTLKKALLSAIYEATIKPVAFQIYSSATSALGLPGAGGGSGGLLNTASNAYGLYDKASSLFGGGANSAFGFAGLAGAGTTAGATAVLPAVTPAAIEAGITATGGSIFSLAAPSAVGATIPVAGGVLSAGGLVASAPAVTAPLAASAPTLGIPGIGWAIGGALLLAGLFGGDNGPKLQSTGDAIRRYDKDGALTENGTNGAWFFTNTEAANKLLDGLESRYQQSAKALGIGTVATQFDYGSNNRGNFALAGAAGNSSANTGEIAYSAEAMQVAASRAVFAALQGSELPKYLSGLLDSVGDINALSQAQIEDVLNTAQAFKGLHDSLTQLPFDGLKDMSYRAAKALVEFSGGMDKFGQNLGTYYDNFYSAEEKKAQTLKNISARLAESGVTASPEVLANTTREGFRALVEGIQGALSPEASSKMVAALLEVSGAFASVTPAATDAATALKQQAEATKAAIEAAASARSALLGNATTGAQSAFDALSRSVAAQQAKDVAANEAQRAIATAAFTSQNALYQQQIDSTRKSLDAVGQSVGKLQSLSGSLKSTLDGLRIAGSDGDYRARAQAQISAALSTARVGGGLPLDGQLASALSTVSKPSEQLFSTFQDYARDFYKTANDIAALGDLTDAQLSADQITQGILTKQVNALSDQKLALKEGFADQLSSLDAILTNAQLQLDAANGINTSVLSVADALTAFASAIAGLESTRAGQGLATSTSTAATTAATARKDAIQQYMQGLADNTNLSDYDKAQTLYAQARLVGVSEAEIAKTVGISAEDARRWFSNFGVPQFAVGTNYVPHDMLAKIHEGEAIIPKAYNPAANGQGGNARLEALVEKLTAEVAELRAAQERGNAHTDRTARILDGQQGVPLLVEIAA